MYGCAQAFKGEARKHELTMHTISLGTEETEENENLAALQLIESGTKVTMPSIKRHTPRIYSPTRSFITDLPGMNHARRWWCSILRRRVFPTC